jgi:hypothetical protein
MLGLDDAARGREHHADGEIGDLGADDVGRVGDRDTAFLRALQVWILLFVYFLRGKAFLFLCVLRALGGGDA